MAGFREVRRRMGRWKASVLRETRRRKKRYWRIRGWAWRIWAFVCGGVGEGFVVGGVWCGEEGGRGSFSMRAQVR